MKFKHKIGDERAFFVGEKYEGSRVFKLDTPGYGVDHRFPELSKGTHGCNLLFEFEGDVGGHYHYAVFTGTRISTGVHVFKLISQYRLNDNNIEYVWEVCPSE